MILTVLESPYRGDVNANVLYGRECLADSLRRGEAPIASHLLLTQPLVLDDLVPEERQIGIAAGHSWYRKAERCAVYLDRGLSDGMIAGLRVAAGACGVEVKLRSLRQDLPNHGRGGFRVSASPLVVELSLRVAKWLADLRRGNWGAEPPPTIALAFSK